jgi:predicted nucleic acid-binding protein
MADFLLDTSSWIDVTAGRKRLPTEFASGTMVVCSLAVAELASLAEQGRVPRDWIGRMLAGSRIEDCTLVDDLEGGLMHGRMRAAGNAKVSIADCIIYCVARRLGVPLLTSDRDLRDQPGVILL